MKILSKAVLMLCLFVPISSGAALLQNGSFENNLGTPGNNILSGGDSTTIASWTTLDPGVELWTPQNFGGIASDGLWVIDLNNYTYVGGGIKQTFATDIGETYNFSFDALTLNTYGRDGTGTVDVSIGLESFSFDLVNYSNNYNWKTYSFEYTATELATTLAFSNSTNSFKHFSFIDNINGAKSVPEPSIIALFGIGLAGFSFARRREQKA